VVGIPKKFPVIRSSQRAAFSAADSVCLSEEGSKMSTTVESDVYTLDWAADALHVSVPTAYRLAQRGELPGAFKAGGQWRISGVRFRAAVHGESSS
jgi:excisionase family DNA binding protein